MKTPNPAKRLLLISNSTLYGSGFLDHAEAEIRDFLRSAARVLFVPFALHDQGACAAKARDRFKRMGYELDSIHETPNKQQAIGDAAAIFIGGGNTFRLLKALYDFELLSLIRQKVEQGMCYMSVSSAKASRRSMSNRALSSRTSFRIRRFRRLRKPLKTQKRQSNQPRMNADDADQNKSERSEWKATRFCAAHLSPFRSAFFRVHPRLIALSF